MKILIIGFQRSGTTLLRRILTKHPDVAIIFHEEFVLTQPDPIEYATNKLRTHVHDVNWGEKIAYYDRGVMKNFSDTIIEYCGLWQKWFKDSIIIHIIRHPLDVAISNERVFGLNFEKTLYKYCRSVPDVFTFIKNNPSKMLNVKLEDVLLETRDTIRNILRFCKIHYRKAIVDNLLSLERKDLKYYNKIEKDVAFLHRSSPELIKEYSIDLEGTLIDLGYW